MKSIIFIVAINFSLALAVQKNVKIKEQTEKVNISEPYIQQQIDKEVNALKENILNNREQVLENKNNINNLFITKLGTQGLIIGGVSGLFAFFGFGYYLKEYLKSKINKNVIFLETECEESLKNVQKIEEETLLRIQNTEIVNNDLRAKSRILLISETSTSVNDSLKQIFEESTTKVTFNCTHIRIKSLSFEEVKVVLVNSGSLLVSDFDMIILDNCDAENRQWLDNQSNSDGFKKEMLNFTNEFLKLKIGFLYFSNDQRFPSREQGFRKLKNKYLLDYVNSHAHLYVNAMNVLKLKNLYNG
ncbi:hypothetical protein [uncultured Tenacibaculum sp.]|uniref:hypothetical protein n=1 Tax=uncultured Tenacibaculum sp. TaxID=174713 RepID=UPI00261111D0|nr:hypothetical protein [uncultured Tenacibaculum sp.]